ncbi:MAG: type II secretion system F family protein [Thermoplasmatales archaeon]|nr:type II secretion system F family protein [Thermoplasmatales archaeon]
MIARKITIFALIVSFSIILASTIARFFEYYALSNILFATAIILFLFFSYVQRKIKEDMLPFIPDEYKEREWKYYFTSLFSFIILLFATILNIFIVFFAINISRVLINILLGAVLLLMLYTVLSIPYVERTPAYLIFFIFSIIFSLVVIASQTDLYHLPRNVPRIIINMADPLFLLNFAMISWMMSLMIGGEMPSPIDSIVGIYESGKTVKEEVVLRRRILYFGIIFLIVGFIAINIIAVLPKPRIFLAEIKWVYVLIGLSIFLLFFLVLYILFILPEKSGVLKEKYDVETVKKIVILSISAVFAAIFIAIAILLQVGKISSIGALSLSREYSIDFAIYAILVSIGPFGFYEYFHYRKINSMEERFPEFLRDLAESRKAGMTEARAVEMAARGDYGHLTPEIKKMAIQISWGIPFTEALRRFGERIKTPLIQRTTTMVIKASEAGGKTADVIEAAATNAREIKILQNERKTEMSLYLMIIYISFFVFLAVIVALSKFFLSNLISKAVSLPGFSGPSISLKEYEFIYICTALAQAIGSGVVAGSITEGKAIAGLRHATIMIIITYLIFKLI